MLIFNVQGLIAVAVGIAVGAAIAFTTHVQALSMVGAILGAMGADIWMRFHSEDCERPLIDPSAGGHLWFIPVWIVGIIAMILLGLAQLGFI